MMACVPQHVLNSESKLKTSLLEVKSRDVRRRWILISARVLISIKISLPDRQRPVQVVTAIEVFIEFRLGESVRKF